MNEEELFDLAIRTPPTELPLLLERECQDRPELRARIERLLVAHKESNVLDAPMPETEFNRAIERFSPRDMQLGETSALEPSSQAGQIIGPYTLETILGEGGMGAVWVAKQNKPVKRRVALKLIKSGMDSRDVLSRFEHERQALAVMDHPNIARVLDAGITPDGRPYFAMELVNGLPLNRFCDEAKLTTEERLDIFVQICSAVQHAHQKGIIHRDLKPANILVTMIDGKSIPKVIDFGVSKALSGSFSEHTLTTQFGAVIGTIEYMAPEQAGYSGTDVDTRADIYALGVILYELLTGLKPFDSQRIRKAALDEMLRIIREEEPSKPSTRLSSSESRPSLAAARGLDPSRLAKKIRGDLDWIALKCLEKDRNRRYETANQLSLEIKRYLADEPIMAGPPSASYQFKKFLRRNRRQVTVAAMVFVALLVGLAASLWQMNRAIIAERAAEKSRDDEKKQRKQADELRIKAEANAKRAEEGGRRAREALDVVTGDVVRSLFSKSTKLTPDERQFFKRLLSLYDGLWEFDGDDRSSMDRRMEGYWHITGIQARLGAYDDAAEALDRMQKVFLDLERRNDPWAGYSRVLALRNAANMSFNLGRMEEGKRFLEQGEEAVQRLLVAQPDNTDFREYSLLFAYDRLRNFPRTDPAAQADGLKNIVDQAEALIQVAKNPKGPAVLMLDCLGFQHDALVSAGEISKALAPMDRILEWLDRSPPERIATNGDYERSKRGYTHLHRGNLFNKLGRDTEAIADYQQGLRIMRERETAGMIRYDDWDILWNCSRMLRSGLADVYERQKKFREAAEQRRLALRDVERWSEYTGDQTSIVNVTAWLQNDLARALQLGGGSREETLDALFRCVEYREMHLDEFDKPHEYRNSIAGYRENAAIILKELGRLDEAIDQRRQAIAIRQELLRELGDVLLASAVRNQLGWNRLDLALALFAKKESALAIEEINRAIASLHEELVRVANDAESVKFKDSARVMIAHGHRRLGDFWWNLGELTKARDAFSVAIEWDTPLYEAQPGDYQLRELLANATHHRGHCQLGLGQFAVAVEDFKAAIHVMKQSPPDDDRATKLVDQWTNLLDINAEKRRSAGHPAEATAVFRDVLALRQGLSAQVPDSSTYRLRVLWSLHNVCIGSIDAGKMEDALVTAHDLAEACVAFGKLHGDDLDQTMNATDTAYKSARRLFDAGRTAAARDLFEAAFAVRSDLVNRFPETPNCYDAMNFARYDVFLSWMAEGNLAAALSAAKSSIDAAQRRKSKFPRLRDSHANYDKRIQSICTVLAEANEFALIREIVEDYRIHAPKDRPENLPLSGAILAQGGRAALALKKYAEAEDVLRQSLAIFVATMPNDWQAFNMRCYVGEAMLGQDKLAEAEAILVEGYEGLFARRASIPPGNTARVRVVAEQLKQLAEKRNAPEDIERWTRELKKLDGETPAKAENAAKVSAPQ
jgi:serine/threonine protein kinase